MGGQLLSSNKCHEFAVVGVLILETTKNLFRGIIKMKKSYSSCVLLLTVFCLLGSTAIAQDKDKYKDKSKDRKAYEFCSGNNWSSNEKVSVKDLRETTISAGDVRVNSKNGRITVIGENRGDVLVRACVSAWGKTEAEARSIANSIGIETSSEIRSEIPEKSNSSVSFEIRVPNASNLDLTAGNGRITISDVDGQIRFKTQNGRVTLTGLSGDVAGETWNGRVTVKLAGNSWQGSGLKVKTSNGRVSLYMASSYAANIDVSTNNGRFSSSFDELQTELVNGKKRRSGAHRVNAGVNGGGAPIRVVTGNGRVSIYSTEQQKQ